MLLLLVARLFLQCIIKYAMKADEAVQHDACAFNDAIKWLVINGMHVFITLCEVHYVNKQIQCECCNIENKKAD
jgi:hypothetical protein